MNSSERNRGKRPWESLDYEEAKHPGAGDAGRAAATSELVVPAGAQSSSSSSSVAPPSSSSRGLVMQCDPTATGSKDRLDSSGGRLKLVSYNTDCAGNSDPFMRQRHAAIVALIREELPDVVCFQEVGDDSVFVELLGAAEYVLVAGVKWGLRIFVRKGIRVLDSGVVDFTCGSMTANLMCGKSMLWVRIVVNGRPVRVVTTHLESMHDSQAACECRVKQFGEVLAMMAGSDEAVICCGDFNLGFNKFNGPKYVEPSRRCLFFESLARHSSPMPTPGAACPPQGRVRCGGAS